MPIVRGARRARQTTYHILESGHPLYNGRFASDPSAADAWKKLWAQRIEMANMVRGNNQTVRRDMLMMAGPIAASGAGGVALGLKARSDSKRRQASLQERINKGWALDKPFLWIAPKSRRGAYRVTTQGEKGPLAQQSKLTPAHQWIGRNQEMVQAAYPALVAGAAVPPVYALMHGQKKKEAQLRVDLRRKQTAERRAAKVNKRDRRGEAALAGSAAAVAGGSHVAAPWATRNRRMGAVRPESFRFMGRTGGAALLGAAGAKATGSSDRQTAGLLAGAGAGALAHQAPGYAHSWYLRGRADPTKAYMNPAVKRKDLPADQKKLRDAWEKKERGPWLKQYPNVADRWRNYPKHWPNARAERFKAHWAGGRKGNAIFRGLVAGGAVAGHQMVGKNVQFGYRERTVSPVRAGEAAVGVAALAWGGSRLKMLGPLAQHGVKAAARRGLESEAQRAVGFGATTGRAVRNATGRGEQALRDKVSGFGTSLDRVPAKMRPSVVAGGGAALTAHAMPVRRERFTPTRGY